LRRDGGWGREPWRRRDASAHLPAVLQAAARRHRSDTSDKKLKYGCDLRFHQGYAACELTEMKSQGHDIVYR